MYIFVYKQHSYKHDVKYVIMCENRWEGSEDVYKNDGHLRRERIGRISF